MPSSRDLSSVFTRILSSNRSYEPDGIPRYGVAATLDANVIRLRLTFLSGIHYCCMESPCHLGFTSRSDWDKIRATMREEEIDAPSKRMRLLLEGVVEEGAMFYGFAQPFPERRGVEGFKPHSRMTYKHKVREPRPK